MPSTEHPDPFAALQADCDRCRALCCVGPAFARSADFAVDKPAGQPCRHLGADDALRDPHRAAAAGFPGCVAYDCFGAGQHVVQVTFGGREREAAMFAVLPVVRALHELLWYLAEVWDAPQPAPSTVRPGRPRARRTADRAATPEALRAVDVDAERAAVDPLLRAGERARAGAPPSRRPAGARSGPAPCSPGAISREPICGTPACPGRISAARC